MKEIIKYCYDLRRNGSNSEEIRTFLAGEGYQPEEIKYILVESDKMFLNSLYKPDEVPRSKPVLKIIVLFFTLLILILFFFGYIRIGLIGLIIMYFALRKTGVIGTVNRRQSVFARNR